MKNNIYVKKTYYKRNLIGLWKTPGKRATVDGRSDLRWRLQDKAW